MELRRGGNLEFYFWVHRFKEACQVPPAERLELGANDVDTNSFELFGRGAPVIGLEALREYLRERSHVRWLHAASEESEATLTQSGGEGRCRGPVF